MGHIRLGRLPKTRKWIAVVNLLESSASSGAVAAGVALAAENRLASLPRDAVLNHCFWLLCDLTWQSRRTDQIERSSDFPKATSGHGSTLAYIQELTDLTRLQEAASPGPFAAFAVQSLRKTLIQTVAGQSQPLFALEEGPITAAFREFSTPTRFGQLAQLFFGDFLARTLSFYVEKELSNSISPDHALRSIREAEEFSDGINLYAFQSARIVRDFAASWYGKHVWGSEERIDETAVNGFVAVALRKLQQDLSMQDTAR